MDILDEMGVGKISATVFFKVNYIKKRYGLDSWEMSKM